MATEQIGVAGLTTQLALRQFERRLLSRFRTENVFNRWATKAKIDKRMGKSISFRKMEVIWPTGVAATWGAQASANSLLLTEGTPPAFTNATWSQTLATVSQYGQASLISDLAEDQSIDDIVPEWTENYSESMRDCMDLLARDVLMAGTNAQYASTAGSRALVGSGMNLTLAELREAKRTLKTLNAKPIRSEGGKFVVLTSPAAVFDLEGDTNITNVYQYGGAGTSPGGNQLFDVTFKDLPLGFRLFESNLVRVFASAGLSGADVIGTLVMGEEAYGAIDLASAPPRIITKARGSSGAIGDPLDQVASVGWKACYAAVRLQENALVRIEHASSSKTAA